MAKPNTVKDGEYWRNCPYCGDSTNPTNCHFSVNISTRKFYCFRCGEGGVLSVAEFMDLTGGIMPYGQTSEPEDRDIGLSLLDPGEAPLQPGPGSPRKSTLPRFHLASRDGLFDAFKLRAPHSPVLGIHLRRSSPEKLSRTLGERGLGFSTERLTQSTIRLVEGPYDCIEPMDVCLCGMPTPAQLRMVRGYSLILCPDGDVWYRPDVLRAYLRVFARTRGLLLLDIEKLPDGADPDEVRPADRERLGRQKLYQLLEKANENHHPRRRSSGFREVNPVLTALHGIGNSDRQQKHVHSESLQGPGSF